MKYLLHTHLQPFLQSQTGFAQFELLLVILLGGIIPTTLTSLIALNHPSFDLKNPEIIARQGISHYRQ